MITLKVTKNQGFTLSLENTFLEKLQENQAFLGLTKFDYFDSLNQIK